MQAVDNSGQRPGLGVFTVPNAITLVRLACLPLFLVLLFGRDDRAAAAYLLAFIGATDWVDGYIARRFGQVSTLGKVLDPTADRLVFLVGAGALIVDGSVPLAIAVLSILREGVVGASVLALAAKGARRIDVTRLGKCATLGMMVAFPLFLAGASDLSWHRGARLAAWIVVVPSLVMSYAAAARYVPLARAALAARSASQPA